MSAVLEFGRVQRSPEIDALRGFFLVWMTLTHLPTHLSDLVNEPFGFVSSAEGFVFLSALLVARLNSRQAPDKNGNAPPGEWVQLVGSSYDRTIHGFQAETTAEQDERLIAYFNDRRDIGHFNLFFHNCVDFSRVVLDIYFPHAIHRNFVADLGVMTPKQAARSLVRFGKKHPELQMTAFTIPQVPGVSLAVIPSTGWRNRSSRVRNISFPWLY